MKLLAGVTAVLGALSLSSVDGSAVLKAEKAAEWQRWYEMGVLGRQRTSVRNQPKTCANNKVTIDGEDFPCDNVDFYSYISLQEMEITEVPHQLTGIAGSDIWGWLSPTGKEITIMGMDNGVAFLDTTNPANPCILGKLPAARRGDTWTDIKVYKDTAYIVKDSRGGDFANDTTIGGEVFDLLKLEELECGAEPVTLENDYVWDFHGSSHNIIVNTETGYLYSVGTDYCRGGLIVIDLNKDRLRPEYVNCIDGDNYTHDAQCVIYRGPDFRYQGREICFAFNEDTLTIWDLDHKYSPSMLARMTYPGQVYTHQGWLSEDMTTIFLDDELNERCNGPAPGNQSRSCARALGPLDGETRTSTIFVDVTSLTNPIYTGRYLHEDEVIDHNLYLWGPIHKYGWGGNPPLERYPNPNYAYLNNYLSGLRVLDVTTKEVETTKEIGFFDIAPDLEELSYLGAWSGYMHPSGAYAVSSIDRGLFMLNPRMAFDGVPPAPTPTPTPGGDGDGFDDVLLLLVVAAALLAVAVVILIIMGMRYSRRTSTELKAAKKIEV